MTPRMLSCGILSICHIYVLYRNGYTYPSFFTYGTKRYDIIPMGTHLKRGRQMQVGYDKIAICDQYLALSRKQYKIGS